MPCCVLVVLSDWKMSFRFLKSLCEDSITNSKSVQISVGAVCKPNTIIGFYFAGSWCSTSKAFTPKLISFNEFHSSNNPTLPLEIIFVSFDRDEKEFNRSISEMPWNSVKFHDKHIKDKISRKFKVHNIPALVLIEADSGKVITSSGMEYVLNDPLGSRFPWYPPPLKDILNKVDLESNNSPPVSYSELEGCFRALYFSAHWCPPCRAFTPLLTETYKKIRKHGHDFVVIFVSSDRSASSFHQYFQDMPWLAVPYEEEQVRKDLSLAYDVQGIPCLILLDSQDNVLTRAGRMEINEDPDGLGFPWRPRYVEELVDELARTLYEEPCLVLFIVEEDYEVVEDLLWPVAEEYYEKQCHADDRTFQFYYCTENELSRSVKEFIGLEEKAPIAAILDIPNNKYYLLQDGATWCPDVLRQFVNRFLSNDLAWNSIKSDVS